MNYRYCKRAKSLLNENNVQFEAVELDIIPSTNLSIIFISFNWIFLNNFKQIGGGEVQAALQTKTNQRTVPNIFIGGKHIGGFDALSALAKNTPDLFKELVKQ